MSRPAFLFVGRIVCEDYMSTPGATAEIVPAQVPAEFTLASFRKGEITATGTSTKPTVEAKSTPPDETPDPDVEADPELRAAIDELEAPPATETPAEKAARTRKHKEAARLGFQTRLRNRLTRLEQENRELRQRVSAPPVREPERPAGSAPRPAVQAESDPSDPEPTLDAVLAAHPDDPDPYARLQRELAAWDRRQERRADEATRATEQARVRATEARSRLERHADHGRGVYRDYDAKLTTLGQLLHGHPADEVLAAALADIDDAKVGGELLYRVASSLDDLKAAVAGGQASLLRFLGRLERDITAAAPKKEPTAPTVTTAPDPHTPVVAAVSTTPTNPFTRPGSAFSVREARAWAKTHGGQR